MNDNSTQIEHWAGKGGEHWVAEEAFYDRMLGPFQAALLAAIEPVAGERVLDVGCGNGALGIALAERGGPGSTLVGVDISTPMLARARERAAAAGIDATYVEADAQVYAFAPASFDLIVSRFGVMFFADPAAAFANLASALRPGGRLAFVCWQDALRNEWVTAVAAAFLEHLPFPDFGPPGAPGPFAFGDGDRLTAILVGAGFDDVHLDPVEVPTWRGDADQALEMIRESSIARAFFAGADEQTEALAWEALRRRLAADEGSEGVYHGGAAWIVTATRRAD